MRAITIAVTLTAATLNSGTVTAQTDTATATASSTISPIGVLDAPNRAPSRSEQLVLNINDLILRLENALLIDEQRQFEANQNVIGVGSASNGTGSR
jgi:hypothetical protein